MGKIPKRQAGEPALSVVRPRFMPIPWTGGGFMVEIAEVVDLLRKAVEDPSKLPEMIANFQDLVWKHKIIDVPEAETLRDLAYDLDFYEPNPVIRREGPSFFGDDKAIAEIRKVLSDLGHVE
jgi:hypothetical protein